MNKLFRKNKKGFTLIELIVVIAIVAILAAIAIPSFLSLTETAEDSRDFANAALMASAINITNTLTPGSIDNTTAMADAETACGDLWPQNVTDEAASWAMITVTAEGVATATAP